MRTMLETQEREESLNGALPGAQAVGALGDAGQLPQEPVVEAKVLRVLVGIPLKGHTPPQSYHDRMLMWKFLGGQEATDFYEKKSPRYVFAFGAVGEILVPYARERLGESAISPEVNADYLFMVDDDMLAPADLFYQLVKHDKPIVAALAFTRNPDHRPVIYETIEGWDASVQQRYGFTKFVNNYPRNTLVECDAVGFGAVLIKTDVLKKVPRPWFFGMAQTGEDVQFCIKAKKSGFSVWMDTSIKLGHLGAPTIITEEYSDAWNKLSPEERDKTYGRFTKYSTESLG